MPRLTFRLQPHRPKPILGCLSVLLLAGSLPTHGDVPPQAMPMTATTERQARPSDAPTAPPETLVDTLNSLQHVTPLQFSPPTIQHFNTHNGVPVAFVQTNNLPMVDVALYFNAGSARDALIKADGYGLASLTANLLDQGSGGQNANQFAEAVEQLGINLAADAHKDMLVISLRSLSDPHYLNPAVALMRQMVTQPTFDPASFERTKAQTLIALQRRQEDPNAVAAERFDAALFGTHPYAHPTDGTPNSVAKLSQADVKKFHQTLLVANNANLAITGNLSLAQAQQLADTLTQTLPKGTPAPALDDAKPLNLNRPQRLAVNFPSEQTSIVIGQLGEKRSPNLVDMQRQTNLAIANDIIGGSSFQARLMADVRKKRGLTYGIYSQMTPMQSRGAYSVTFSTRQEKAQEATDAALAVIRDAQQQGVTQAEVNLAKASLTNRFPLALASNAAINDQIGMMGFYHLPDGYLTHYLDRIEQANLADINQAYHNLINPNQLLIVSIGPTNQADATLAQPQPSSSPPSPPSP